MRIRICVLDETEDWIKEITDVAGKVFGVYLYTPDSVTYCCEMTPSYELHFLGSKPMILPEDDIEHDKLLDDIYERNFCTLGEVSYHHVSGINRLHKIKRRQLQVGTYHYGTFNKREKSIDDVIEAYHENPDY